MQVIEPTKMRMPRCMSWVILAAILFLMLTSLRMTESTLGSVRDTLFYLRWLPLVVLGSAALVIAVWNRSLPRSLNRVDAVILVFIGLALLSALYSIDPEISVLRGLSVLLMYGAVFWGVWVCADEFGAAAVMRIMVAAAGIVIGLHVVVALFDPIGSMPYLGRFRGWALNPGTPGGAAALLLPLALWHALGRPRWQHWMLVGAMILVLILSQTRSEIFAALVGSLYFLLRVRSHRKLFVIFSGVAVLVVSLAWVEIGPRLLPQGTDILTDLFPEKVASSMVTTVEAGDVEGTGASIAGAGVGTGDVEGTGASIAGAGVGTGDVEGTGASGVGAGVGTGDTESARASDVGDIETALDQWSETKVRWYDRENPRNDTAITLSNRIGKWTLGAQYFLERPLMGFGFGTEDQLFDLYGMRPVEYVYTGTYFHNSYLGLALQLGLMGAVLFYLPLGLLVSREIRFANRPPPDLMRTALMAVVLTGMVSGLFSSDLYSMGNPKTVSFWICVMLLQRCNHSPVVNSDVGGLLGRTTRQYKC